MDMKSSPRPKANPGTKLAPAKSPRPKANPGTKLAPKTSPRPKASPPGPGYDAKSINDRSLRAMAKGGVVRGGGAAIRGKKFSGSY